jgi:cyclophilin family peptidyl-prolyl cis-trans isomerase/HEAT repeat protein
MRLASLLLALGVAAFPLGAQPPTLDQLIRAEDARARSAADLATLRAGATARDPELRRAAVRGLGRLERSEVLPDVIRALDDADAGVRRAAADAVAQAVAHGDTSGRARDALRTRLPAELDAGARGQLAESLGRIRADAADVARTAETLASLLPERGAVRGLFFLTRQPSARGRVPAPVAARLQSVATTAALPADVRATAASARLAAGGTTADDSSALASDASGDVRVRVATADFLRDPAPVVRYRAVALAACPALVGATRDANAHVALAAVDALSRCAGDAAAVSALEASPSARAVTALAAIAPERARLRLPALLASRDPFVRTHAARAARKLSDVSALTRLAGDADPNVASEAIDGLSALTAHAGDAVYLAALRSDASQQLMSAAKALTGAGPAATAPLVAALDRVTARRRETSRDARLALVEALGAAVPARYARDFDPAVARRAAELAGVAAAPTSLPAPAVPTVAQLRSVRGATIEMADGGRIELRLFPLDAPTNTWRFVRLARAGWFDGLTFHRIAPFFVVQGGSPLANEYVGDGPFTRDEVGLENRRGTVGVSTRGRDTGDGQLYFNTVDNVRLDHDYTVFAEVVRGMDVVDRMQEGARMRRVTVF